MGHIDYGYLLAFGILLIGLEALTFTFLLFFLGVAFILVSIISYFIHFDNGLWQIAIAFMLSVVLAVVFRQKLIDKISKPKKEEEKIHKSGIGEVDGDMVKFDGSYWQSITDLKNFKNKEKVKVIDVIENKVVIEKL